jgi:hypothetical protein
LCIFRGFKAAGLRGIDETLYALGSGMSVLPGAVPDSMKMICDYGYNIPETLLHRCIPQAIAIEPLKKRYNLYISI